MMGRFRFLHISLCLFLFLSGLHVAEVTGSEGSDSMGAKGRAATHTSEKLPAKSANNGDSNFDDSASSEGSEDTSEADSESHDSKKAQKPSVPKKISGKTVAPMKAAGQKIAAKNVPSDQNMSSAADFSAPETASFTGAPHTGSENFGSMGHVGVGNDEGVKVSQIIGNKKNVRKAGSATPGGRSMMSKVATAAPSTRMSGSKALANSGSKKRNIIIAIIIIVLIVAVIALSVGAFLYKRTKTTAKDKKLNENKDSDVEKEKEKEKEDTEEEEKKPKETSDSQDPADIQPAGLSPPEQKTTPSKDQDGDSQKRTVEEQLVKTADDMVNQLLRKGEEKSDDDDEKGGPGKGGAGGEQQKKTGIKHTLQKAASSFGKRLKGLGSKK